MDIIFTNLSKIHRKWTKVRHHSRTNQHVTNNIV